MAGALVFEGGLSVVALGLGWAFDLPPFDTARVSGTALAAAAAGAVPPLVFLWWLLRTGRPEIARLRDAAEGLLGPMVRSTRAPALALLAVLAGLGEEALFRGVLQRAAAGVIGPAGGWLLAGAVFGLLHWLTPLYAVLATLAGLYLGAMFILTENILVPILIHAVYDAAALGAMARRAAVSGDEEERSEGGRVSR